MEIHFRCLQMRKRFVVDKAALCQVFSLTGDGQLTGLPRQCHAENFIGGGEQQDWRKDIQSRKETLCAPDLLTNQQYLCFLAPFECGGTTNFVNT
jgi:hypothetical protein